MTGIQANEPTHPQKFSEARVAISIVNYRTPKLAKRCMASLVPERKLLSRLEVVLVDGGSGDDSAEELANAVHDEAFRDWVSFLPLSVNGGFGWANNSAISMLLRQPMPPEFIHLLNPDCELEPGAVVALANYLREHPRVGAVGSQLLEIDGSITGSAFNFPTVRGEFSRGARTRLIDRLIKVRPISVSATSATEVEWVTGASVMFRTAALKEAGLFDEGFFLYHEETELMWRLGRTDWLIAFEPRSRVRHVGGASTGVHGRKTEGSIAPRRPAYWYRSRARLFARTRGELVAVLAFLAWLAGHAIWLTRRVAGLAKDAKPISHQLRDHMLYAVPRRSDGISGVRAWDETSTDPPIWMERGWL